METFSFYTGIKKHTVLRVTVRRVSVLSGIIKVSLYVLLTCLLLLLVYAAFYSHRVVQKPQNFQGITVKSTANSGSVVKPATQNEKGGKEKPARDIFPGFY